ncbi:protein of unknown function (plasmid) [Paraburkholderia dioscoreae]|uniref:Tn3 transposase DDE domain-containing protein n=1 Tax=Paraburkholderia dioscoreae TaxID=2604047 RepID=A0A5Q4Z9J7_9BURK|nr:protein of unknown function [Paraburkholderia dioscoreae]
MKGLTRKEVAWLNLKHVPEERLDKANVKVINAYNRFALPKYWGSGKRASADGTKCSPVRAEPAVRVSRALRWIQRDRLLSRIRHVHRAVQSLHPCGVHEAVYNVDGLILNGADIKPGTIHGERRRKAVRSSVCRTWWEST